VAALESIFISFRLAQMSRLWMNDFYATCQQCKVEECYVEDAFGGTGGFGRFGSFL